MKCSDPKFLSTAKVGIVTQVHSHESESDQNNYECDVWLLDSNLELKKVPILTQNIGAVAIPNQDDFVMVQFLDGDIHSAFIAGRIYNDIDRSPQAKPNISSTSPHTRNQILLIFELDLIGIHSIVGVKIICNPMEKDCLIGCINVRSLCMLLKVKLASVRPLILFDSNKYSKRFYS